MVPERERIRFGCALKDRNGVGDRRARHRSVDCVDACQNAWSKGSAQAENDQERFVDSPEFLVCEMTDQVAQPSGVHCADLLD